MAVGLLRQRRAMTHQDKSYSIMQLRCFACSGVLEAYKSGLLYIRKVIQFRPLLRAGLL